MLVPRTWLQQFVDVSDTTDAALTDAFNSLGLVVEGVERIGEGLDGVITAKVRTIRPHPDADKIRLVDVTTGDDSTERLQIACGAWNFEEGDVVPLATLGTTMPDGMKIERRKLRGEWSNGMLCSGRELGLSDDHAGILRLPVDTPLGLPVTEALGLAIDTVFDLGIEANRPDAMSILGVARDLAPKLGKRFAPPRNTFSLTGVPAGTPIRGSVASGDLCDRLTVTILHGVRVAESPDWIKALLTAGGMRPISNIVDASNFVMLEYGIPSHAFDLAKLAGGRIGVRWATPDETIETLDGAVRTLSPSTLPLAREAVITDGNDVAVGVAGIMGGASTEVTGATTDVLLELARWVPIFAAKASKRLGLRSEASVRFEKGADPLAIPMAIERFVDLLRETCPELSVESYDDVWVNPYRPLTVEVRTSRTNLVLGTELDTNAIKRLLDPIGFTCVTTDRPDVLSVTIPSWRNDATGEIDVIEEVGRHHGYDLIERKSLATQTIGSLSDYQRARRRVADLLVDRGCDEVWTAAFLGDADIAAAGLDHNLVRLANPMVADEAVLRPSLLPGLLGVLRHNANHRNPAMRIFEIGHVFTRPLPEQVVPYEREYLTIALAGEGDDARSAVALLDTMIGALRLNPATTALKPAELPAMHPTRSARIVGTGTGFSLGFVGEVDPQIAAAWGVDRRIGLLSVDLENLCALPKRAEEIASWSRFPSSDIDLAFVVPNAVSADQVRVALRKGAGRMLQELELFDLYRGKGIDADSRGLTFRLRFASPERTLTDADVAGLRQGAIDAAKKIGATLRG